VSPPLAFALFSPLRTLHRSSKARFDPGQLPSELFKHILELASEPDDSSTGRRDLATVKNCMFSRRWRSVAQDVLFQRVELNLNDDQPKAWIEGVEARLKRRAPPTPMLSLALSNAKRTWKPQKNRKIPEASLHEVLENASTLRSLSLVSLTIDQADFAMESLQGTWSMS